MSAPGTAPFPRPDARPWLSVLLPFTALGLLPWWVCLTLSAALALGRWTEDARSIGVLLVLLAAVLVSAPLLLGSVPDRLPASGTLFAQAALVGLLSFASQRALEQGRRQGLLLPAAAVLLVPGPGGLAALLLAGLSLRGAETGPPVRFQRTPGQSRRMLQALLGAVLLLTGAAALLGTLLPAATRQAAPAVSTRSTPPRPDAAPRETPPAARSAAAVGPVSRPAVQTPAGEGQDALLRPLIPFTGLLIVVCLVLLFQRVRVKRAAGRSTWADYAAVAAMLGTLFMLGILGVGAGRGGVIGGAASQAAGPGGGRGAAGGAVQAGQQGSDWLTPLMNAGLIFSTLFFAAVAVFLYLALRRGPEGEPGGASGSPGATDSAPPPLHRVRLAWRRLETALAASGLARLSSETPEEFAARLALLLPAAAADLHTLTRLYLPVRYGGELSEAQATRAEAAEASVRRAVQAGQA